MTAGGEGPGVVSTTAIVGGARALPVFDGEVPFPAGCPRGLACQPLSRYASDGMASYMCCGDNGGDASVPTDTFRLCIKSTHRANPADILVNLDELDVTHTLAVLAGALASNACVRGNPMEHLYDAQPRTHPEQQAPEAQPNRDPQATP